MTHNEKIKRALWDAGADELSINRFLAWKDLNKPLWSAFCEMAKSGAGLSNKPTAKLIMELLRREQLPHIEKFKANNNWTSFMAHAFMAVYPRYDGLFRTKRLSGFYPHMEGAE